MGRPKHIKETRFEYLKRTIQEHLAGPKRDECLRWPFALTEDGYGTLAWNPSAEFPSARMTSSAHRLSYFLTYGAWPDPLGMHICPVVTKGCYNPLHIVPGTDAENAKDREDRGRGRDCSGANNPAAKLTDEIVRQIRADSIHMRQKQLVKKYGVSRGTIRRALSGEYWAHVPFPENPRLRYGSGKGNAHHLAKLTEQDVIDMRKSSLSAKQLAALYNLEYSAVRYILTGKHWKHVPMQGQVSDSRYSTGISQSKLLP